MPVPEGGLSAALADIARGSREPAARASSCAPTAALDYGRVMAVMGEINRAGLRRVAMVTHGAAERRRR